MPPGRNGPQFRPNFDREAAAIGPHRVLKGGWVRVGKVRTGVNPTGEDK